METKELKLITPINVIGERRETLNFTPVNGAMLMKAGSYLRTRYDDDGTPSSEILPAGMGQLIAASAKIPMRSVEEMSFADFTAATGIIIGFLAATPASSSTVTLSAADGGGTSNISFN